MRSLQWRTTHNGNSDEVALRHLTATRNRLPIGWRRRHSPAALGNDSRHHPSGSLKAVRSWAMAS